VWLYFVGAFRDPAMFGSTANTFVPERYYNSSSDEDGTKQGFAFGDGPKACLGAYLMREVAMTVAKTCIGILSTILDRTRSWTYRHMQRTFLTAYKVGLDGRQMCGRKNGQEI